MAKTYSRQFQSNFRISADNSKATLEYLRQKEEDLTKEEWALADLCGGYVHIYNLAEEFRLFDKSLLPRNTSIH